ncbi:MAG: HAD family hydrolase, partial [Roseimicrobium sp.]
MLQIPSRDFAAYIFDCDGTLVDSMPIHYVCWIESLRVCGATFPFSEDDFYHYAGVREQDTVVILNELHGTAVNPDAVAETKAALFRKRVHEVPRVEPVARFAESLHGRAPMSVASGSEAPIVHACLTTNGLVHLFEHIITPADVK